MKTIGKIIIYSILFFIADNLWGGELDNISSVNSSSRWEVISSQQTFDGSVQQVAAILSKGRDAILAYRGYLSFTLLTGRIAKEPIEFKVDQNDVISFSTLDKAMISRMSVEKTISEMDLNSYEYDFIDSWACFISERASEKANKLLRQIKLGREVKVKCSKAFGGGRYVYTFSLNGSNKAIFTIDSLIKSNNQK